MKKKANTLIQIAIVGFDFQLAGASPRRHVVRKRLPIVSSFYVRMPNARFDHNRHINFKLNSSIFEICQCGNRAETVGNTNARIQK